MASCVAARVDRRPIPMLLAIAGLTFAGISVPRVALAAEPTEQEQFMVERINRARLDPVAEVLRVGLAGGLNEGPPTLGGQPYTIPAGPHQAVAISTTLTDAARDYATDLNDADVFCHDCLGTNPEDRMAAQGYVDSVSDFVFGAASISGVYGTSASGNFVPGRENLAARIERPSDGSMDDLTGDVDFLHEELFKDLEIPGRGHRSTMMYGQWKEIGVGLTEGTDFTNGMTWDSVYIVVNFAHRSDTGPFITGVVYEDVDEDGFYTPDIGEPKGGVSVSAVPSGGGAVVNSTTTFASGGYSLSVPIGIYDVTFSGTGISETVVGVVVAAGPEGVAENTKVDVVPEPGALPMHVVGLATLASFARRRWTGRA